LRREILFIGSDSTVDYTQIEERDTPMEPQTKITNSPEQNQAKPPKDSFTSIITSPRYWLAWSKMQGLFMGEKHVIPH
jgi:hypothetical protein